MIEDLRQPDPGVHASTASSRVVPLRDRVQEHLHTVVILGGSVDRSALRKATGRLPLDLPVDSQRRIIDLWYEQASGLAEHLGLESMDLRVMIDQEAPMLEAPRGRMGVKLSVDRDPSAYRGTGGLLRDLADQREVDEWLLVAGGAQIPVSPLAEVIDRMAGAGGDAVIASNADGEPSGFLLIRCGALESIAASGFVDMKEQGLATIAKRHRVMVAGFDLAPSLSVRNRSRYLSSLRLFHQMMIEGAVLPSAFDEQWQSAFGLVEDGGQCESDATLHDSVVLRGGRVESGATAVRSLVCSGAAVRRRQTVQDRFVSRTSTSGEKADHG